jgi:hypothetical protein
MDPLLDPGWLALDELKLLITQLVSREHEVSHARQMLHAQIDALRRELVDRLRDEGKTVVIFGPDALGPGTSGVREPRAPRPQWGSDGAALPEPLHPAVQANERPRQNPPHG